MKARVVLLSLIILTFCYIPCYADPPGLMAQWAETFLSLMIISGVIIGFIIKVVLHYLRIAVSNWLIFLSAIILAGLILYMLIK